eukprot:351330-Chlamydomonas_euryale.AAC.3
MGHASGPPRWPHAACQTPGVAVMPCHATHAATIAIIALAFPDAKTLCSSAAQPTIQSTPSAGP